MMKIKSAVPGVLFFFAFNLILPFSGTRAEALPLAPVNLPAALPDCSLPPVPLPAAEFEKQMTEIQKEVQAAPENAEAIFDQAELLSDQKRFEEAIALYTRALELKPDFTDARANRGYAYDEIGKLDLALQDAQDVLKADPSADSWFTMGVVHFDQGHYEAALKDYQTSLSLNKDDKCTHNNLGLTYEALGDRKAAIAQYNEALAIDPSFKKALRNRTALYLEQGSYLKAFAGFVRLWWVSAKSR